jgi:methyl-accepting chemotaxis protein
MQLIRDTKLGIKLVLAFLLVVGVFVGVAAYQITGMDALGRLQDHGATRFKDAEEILQINNRLESLYTIAADAIINRNLKESRADLNEYMVQAGKDMARVKEMATTDAQRKEAEDYFVAYKAYMELIHKKLLPYLEGGGQDMSEIQAMDARIDALREASTKPLESIAKSIEEESLKSDADFDATRKATISTSLAVSGAGVLVAILVAAVMTLSITRPLKKATAFALELAAGTVDKDLPVRQRDEVGEVCWALRRITEALRNMLGEFAATTDLIAVGRLRARGDASKFKGAFSDLIADANRMADTLVSYLDMVPAPIMAIDNEFSIQFMNQAGAKAGGRDPVKLQGTKCHEHFQTGDCQTPGCACDRAMKARAEASSETVAHPGGGELEIVYSATPITNRQGAVVGAFEMVTDQTEIKRSQKKMQRLADQAQGIANNLSSAAEELSAQVEESSRGADIQRERATETATAMEQMNSTVMEVARSASNAAKAADATQAKARQGAKNVEALVTAVLEIKQEMDTLSNNMTGLGKQAEGISGILNVISDIADQTNLLALNAAIEAARAGDAGRGFAVVADEVRKLAEKTMTATKEVGDAIAAIQDGARRSIDETQKAAQTVADSAATAQASGAALNEIVALAEETSDQVRAIATASEQQSAASEQINRSTEEINRISAETAETMGQSAQAVVELARLAQDLGGLIKEMNA